MEQLFDKITELTGDKTTSAKIFLALNDYVYKNETAVKETVEPGEEYEYIVNSKNLDFGSYVFDNFTEQDWARV